MPAALVLPADERVTEALARLGMATVSVIGPAGLREALAGSPGEREAVEVDLLAGLLAGG